MKRDKGASDSPAAGGLNMSRTLTNSTMIELHCRKCSRSVEFRRADFPDVPAWVARIEHDKCNICDDGDRSAEHWMDADGSAPDPDTMPTVDDERPCTDCGDTGITFQTERRCSCQPPLI